MKLRRPALIALWVIAVAVAAAGILYQDRVLEAFTAGKALRPDDQRTVAQGREIYRRECASCHGVNLEGQPNWRQRLANGRMPAPPHDQTGHTWHHPDIQLFELTKFGPAALIGGGYQSDMPAYEGVLDDNEIIAVLSFIKSRWPGAVRKRHDQLNARAAQ